LQGIAPATRQETKTVTVAVLLRRADGAPPLNSFRKGALGTGDPFARCREIGERVAKFCVVQDVKS